MRLLIIRLFALLSACGGPLVVYGLLEPYLQSWLAFAIAFLPIMLMLLGTLSLDDDDGRDRFARVVVYAGLVGVAMLLPANVFAVVELISGGPQIDDDRGLVIAGVVVGVVASVIYVIRAQRWLRPQSDLVVVGSLKPTTRHGPTAEDWGLLALNLVFVAMGIVILPKQPSLGTPCLTLFGLGAAVFVDKIVSKRRLARLDPLSTVLAWNVPHHARQRRVVLGSLALILFGLEELVFGRAYPLLVQVILGFAGIVGLGQLVVVACGMTPERFIQFERRGLVIARRRYRYLVPWAAIDEAEPDELQGHPALLLQLHDPHAIEVEPSIERQRAVDELQSTARSQGWHVTLMTARYGLDLPVVWRAVDQRLDMVRRERA